jgi:hypothetical protein
MGVVRIINGCVLEGRGLIHGMDRASASHFCVQTVLGPSVTVFPGRQSGRKVMVLTVTNAEINNVLSYTYAPLYIL